MRKARRLKSRTKKQKPIKTLYDIVVDTEAYLENVSEKEQHHHFRCGVAIDSKGEKFYFTKLESFFTWLAEKSKKHKKIQIFAHNMRKYDSLMLRIYKYMWEVMHIKLTKLYDEGSYFAIFSCKKRKI